MKKIDYTSFNGQDTGSVPNKQWWKANKTDRAQAIAGVVKFLAQNDSRRQTQYQESAKLYGNVDLVGLSGLSFAKIQQSQGAMKARISYNVIQSAIDTLVSKLAKNKPKPLFLTSGGDYKIQRKAKKLDKFVEGIFYENDAYHIGTEILRDGGVLADGIVHVFEQHDRVKFERVIPSELYVDWVESFYGEPRQMHRVKNVDRQVLMDLFPDKKRAISEANAASADLIGQYQNISDQLAVVESWHLPSGPDAGDGLHCICLEQDTLFEEEWTKDFFPFSRFRFSPKLYGFWSQSGCEQIQNLQLEINKILWVIQRSFHLAGSFKVLLEKGSKVVKEHLNNDVGSVIEYNGTAPQYITPPIVPVEMYQHLKELKNAAYEQFGISQLSASSQKPAGLNSGKALREYNDIESDRFLTIGQEYERFFLTLARLTVDVAKDIYSRKKTYKVKVPGKKFIDEIDWKDIDLEEDEYVMKIFPVSSLPNDPAGRLQTIQEYVQAGMIDPITGRRLLDFPDLEQQETLANAQEDWINMYLEKIVDEGEYNPPEPEMSIPLAKQLTLQYIAQGHVNNLDPDRMDQLRLFNSQLDMLTQQAQSQQPQGAQPQAQPQPTPQSDLVQNVPGAQGVQGAA